VKVNSTSSWITWQLSGTSSVTVNGYVSILLFSFDLYNLVISRTPSNREIALLTH
jgi:hypothetical protein